MAHPIGFASKTSSPYTRQSHEFKSKLPKSCKNDLLQKLNTYSHTRHAYTQHVQCIPVYYATARRLIILHVFECQKHQPCNQIRCQRRPRVWCNVASPEHCCMCRDVTTWFMVVKWQQIFFPLTTKNTHHQNPLDVFFVVGRWADSGRANLPRHASLVIHLLCLCAKDHSCYNVAVQCPHRRRSDAFYSFLRHIIITITRFGGNVFIEIKRHQPKPPLRHLKRLIVV